MAGDRKKVTKFILDRIAAIVPDDDSNVKLLKSRFEAMSDKEFEDYIRRLGPAHTAEARREKEILPFYIPNLGKFRISIAHMFKLAKEQGRPLTEKLIVVDPSTGNEYLTPHECPIFLMPVRRQAQTMIKKRSVPEADQQVDDLTGQPTNQSKGSRISSPEHGSIASRGLDNTAQELLNARGGNESAYREMKRLIIETGTVELKQLEGIGTVKSSKTASVLLAGMHLGNNLDPNITVPDDAKP